MDIDRLAIMFLAGCGLLVAWFSWLYVTYGAELLQVNLLAAGVAAVVSVVICWALR